MKVEETKTVTVQKYVCDEPGCKNPQHTYGPSRCCICEKDLCRDHFFLWDESPDGNMGDFPEAYCKNCLELGKPMREAIVSEMKRHDDAIEALYARWRETVS